MRIVDAWAQVITPRMEAQPWLATLDRWTGRDKSAPDANELVAAMNQARVDQALVAAWYGPMGDLISNDEVAGQIAVAPGRLFGLASADIRNPVAAVREIRQWLGTGSFVGVRIVPWLWDLPPNDRRYYPLYAECVEHGVPLCTQIGHTGPLKRSETGRMLPYLEDVMLDFPDLVVVGGHVGFPWLDELITMTVKFPNFYVDSSAYSLARLPTGFVDYVKGLGRSRAMFGTNWPMIDPGRSLSALGNLGLDDTTTERFLGATAAEVFRLPEPISRHP